MTSGKRGFTLVEVVISIATLALVSVFILQMFIVSAQLSRDAADIDRAVALSAAVMDTVSAQASIEDARGNALFERALTERAGARETTITLYYGVDWEPIEPAADESAAAYTLVAHITEPPDAQDAQSMDIAVSPLTYISVKVQRNAASGASVMALADISGAHYYGGER